MAYNIKLDVFEGPLDLLLHLIKENQVDIYDIPIALITEQYFQYIEIMKTLNLELAGEYLVMASTLTYIKSRMLLPKHEQEEEEAEEGVDPRDELVAKLVEYKRIKEAAGALKTMEMEQSMIFPRQQPANLGIKEGDLLLEVSVLELLKSFKKILDNYKGPKQISVTLQEISVTDKINEIMATLEKVDHIQFEALFARGRTRMEVVATFLALLELMRLKLVKVNQVKVGGDILLYRAPENGHSANGEEDLPPATEEPEEPARVQMPEGHDTLDENEVEEEEAPHDDNDDDGFPPES
ncbi:MAG: segregation/condensation protein A [Nitrospinota bacterium]|nr:segregation/condensation protein A [Nitrospinota bacterium]